MPAPFNIAEFLRPVSKIVGAAFDPGRRHRRLWVADGRAHIEVRGLDGAANEGIRSRAKSALEALEGVHWAEVNAITARVAVIFDGDAVGVDDLVEVLEGVEEAEDWSHERFPAERPEHPGDSEPLRRNLAALTADVLGLGVSIFGQVLEATPIPAELASLVTLVDSTPRFRRVLEHHLGHALTDVGLAMANALAQALGQGPAGLALDIGNRLSLISEITARNAVWERREPELTQRHHGPVVPVDTVPRPVPLPPGPIERYTDAASLASLGGFALTWALTASPRQATTALLVGLPKAARMGREGFATQTGRVLADRGVVVLDPGVLRRLDRIDTVVVEATVLTSGRSALGRCEGIGSLGAAGVLRRAQTLFDPENPRSVRRRGRWSLFPLTRSSAVPRELRPRAKPLGGGRTSVLALARDDEVVGLVEVVAELDPLAEALAAAVRDSGLRLLVAGLKGGVGRQLGAETSIAGGWRLADAVRTLQADGHAVALIGRAPGALTAADCGIGLFDGATTPPWAADLLCGPGLGNACLVVDALAVARRTSRRSAALALAGSAVGATWAVVGWPLGAANRAMLAINGAGMLALGAGAVSGAALVRRPPPSPVDHVSWHELDSAEVVARLRTSSEGLDEREARRRLQAADDVRPSVPPPPSFGRAVVEELVTPLTPVLAAGAALAAATGSLSDAGLVGGVVAANAVVSAAERVRTEGALQRLITTTAPRARVRRDHELVDVAAEQLVPGDVVSLVAADVVPADCRVLAAVALEVDESALTGESLPVAKADAVCPGAAVADRTCMLYQGTTVVAGTGEGVVVAVGATTEAARALDRGGDPPPTGVEARLRAITTATIPASVLSGAAVAAVSLLRGRSTQTAVGAGVGVMVASVPEGLPLLASVAQLAAARRLAARNVLVRNPSSVEALGRVNVLCFDKTGTLTEGRIRLQRVSDGREDVPVDRLGPAQVQALRVALRATPLAVEGEAVPHATDQAVIEGAAEAAIGTHLPGDEWVPLAELPFAADRALHAVLGQSRHGCRIAVKGAPEVVLPHCKRWNCGDGLVVLDAPTRRTLRQRVEQLAGRGLRVLAVAERPADPNAELRDAAMTGLDLVGFVAFADNVRPTAAAAVASLRSAGVDVAMITGDHPSTATAIARDLGILNGERVLTGSELDRLDDESLAAVLADVSVFARVTPAHKVRIVEGLQRAGRVVAMTGDGANDVAAIRLAHAGIAVGHRGAAPARLAADVVVIDDRIETLLDAIVEGRAMWVSVRDALAILVGGNVGEVAFTLLGTGLTGRSPLNPRQLLVVNMLTDLLPAMAIAMRPPRAMTPEALLHEGPEASLGGPLVRDIAWRAASTTAGAAGAWAVARATGPAARASTVGLVALVGTQLGQTVVSGASPFVIISSVAAGASLVGIVQTPVVSQFFGCTPLDPLAWATAAGAATLATAASVAAPAVVRLFGLAARGSE